MMESELSTDGKIKSREEIKAIVENIRKNQKGKKIITTNGAFDILHTGHVGCLDIAKSLGDYLIVGLNSDASIKRYKSKDRPIIPQHFRAKMLSSLQVVDYVVIFDEDDPRELLGVIKPDIHTKSKSGFKGIEREVVESNGGKIFLVDDVPGLSTTFILERLKQIEGIK
jgi:D-beta-D-heptose 7-phosphate kinase/D-beta-D-heptose 1-phosphate adenosyltransferase